MPFKAAINGQDHLSALNHPRPGKTRNAPPFRA